MNGRDPNGLVPMVTERGSVASKRRALPPAIYQIQVMLEGISPPIWRQFQVPAELTLHQLHQVLQAVMGWQDYHLYEFVIGTRHYGEPDDEFPGPRISQAKWTRLRSALRRHSTMTLTYEYDFGDGWRHHLVIEDILAPEPGVTYPHCLAGARRCPPEDCGGVTGYFELQRVLADPDDEEHAHLVEWARAEYDPEAFDLDQVNDALRRILDGTRRSR